MSVAIFCTLFGNIKMPALGFGTWQANADLEKALEAALEAGYRHIDTAYAYQNEEIVGKVINRWVKEGKLERKDLFLVTKLPSDGNYAEGVPKYLKRSLANLQVDYVDLYLVHGPFRTSQGSNLENNVDHIAIWKAMEDQQNAGLTKAIGLSNFNIKQISNILKSAKIPPASLQVELNAYFQQAELLAFCKNNNITITAFSPLGSPGLRKRLTSAGKRDVPDILANPVVNSIAEKHKKTEAQILLRHLLQKGVAAIPKSVTPSRIKQNIDIFDFTLDESDMDQMNKLDKGPAARVFDFSDLFDGVKDHPEYPF